MDIRWNVVRQREYVFIYIFIDSTMYGGDDGNKTIYMYVMYMCSIVLEDV